jgi:hypothetical protein
VALAARFGGGPGAPPASDDLREHRAALVAGLGERTARWRRAEADLAAVVARLVSQSEAAPVATAVGVGP